ncbi:MAG: hypothetical protein EZS28_045595, partial [Streblomastix strix]
MAQITKKKIVQKKQTNQVEQNDPEKLIQQLSKSTGENGALKEIVQCLNGGKPSIKENALITLGKIANHDAKLAQYVVDAGAIPLIVQCLTDPKHIAAAALSNIVKYSLELAQYVVDAGGIAAIVDFARNIRGTDRLPGIMCLGEIAAKSE